MTHEVTEDFSPRDPRTVVVKQDGGGCTSVTPALHLPELEREEEKEGNQVIYASVRLPSSSLQAILNL